MHICSTATRHNELLDIISAQFFLICRKWQEHFCVEDIQFFC